MGLGARNSGSSRANVTAGHSDNRAFGYSPVTDAQWVSPNNEGWVNESNASDQYFSLGSTVSLASAQQVTFNFAGDNNAWVFVNGQLVGTNTNWGAQTTATAQLNSGCNTITYIDENSGGEYAGAVSAVGSNGQVLLATGTSSFDLLSNNTTNNSYINFASSPSTANATTNLCP